MIKRINCSSFNCSNTLRLTYSNPKDLENLNFCKECKEKHSQAVLQLQVEHQKDIKDLLIEAAKQFRSCEHISNYLGVTFVTVYNWIKYYFNMNFQEFKREFICNSKGCHIVDISRSSYSRTDYILKKIQKQNYCACVNALDSGLIMTKASPALIEKILRGFPKVEKIKDSFYSISPNPVLDIGLKKPYRFPEGALK